VLYAEFLIYKRRPIDGGGLDVDGERGLLDLWLARVDFG
jgi:hypothetical protein